MKPSCREIDPLMTPYVDGEAAPGDREVVERHLGVCLPCRVRAEAERTARAVVRSRAVTLVDRAPQGLRARCVAAAPMPGAIGVAAAVRPGVFGSRARRWLPLSMAATALFAVAAVFWLGQGQELEAAFAAQLVKDHQKCFMSLRSAGDLDPADVEARLEAQYGWQMRVPASSSEHGIRLVEARRCLYADGAVAHLLYDRGGHHLSLFIVPEAHHAEQVLELIGHDALIWSDRTYTYALIGDEGDETLRPVAAYVRRVTEAP